MSKVTSQQSQTVAQGEDSPRVSPSKLRTKNLRELEVEARNGAGADVSPVASIANTLSNRRQSRWSPEARRMQAERCRRTQPWKRSTGPTSSEGKKRVAENGRHNQRKPGSIRDCRASVADVGGMVEQLADFRRLLMP